MFIKFICTFLLVTMSAQAARALTYPETFGFDASMEASGQVLSSPALPSLDNDGRFSISPLFGTVKIEGVDYTASLMDGTPLPIENHGTVNGQVAGLTFNYSGTGNLGFFAIAAGSKVQGDLSSSSGPGLTTDVRNISAVSYVGAIGVTYRLVGDAKSKFALGIFGGPALIKANTTSEIYHAAGVTKVMVNPDLRGYYLGLQFTIRLGQFRINPYLNVLGNTDPQCLKPEYSGDAYVPGQYNLCSTGERGVSTFAVMSGGGINVGYGRFQFGIISKGGSDAPGLKSTPLMLSFRITL